VPRVINYGGIEHDDHDDGEDNVENGAAHAHQHRRSTVSTLRQSIVTITSNTKEVLHSHVMSTLALCTSVLSMMYLLMSAFPYSGFMAMQLIPGLTHESAGTYAGILSGSFMIGRLFSAYPWGVISDTYGRKFVLIFSTLTSAVLMVAFGLSYNFAYAVCIRFLTGLCNGTMIAARVSVTELAKGDHDLEAKGMGLVMSMVGFGMLVGPAIGGVLSEPVTQYPNLDFGVFEGTLTRFPFLLPNLIGAILCAVSSIQIALSVEETLPPEKLRDAKYVVPDALRCLGSIPSTVIRRFKSKRRGEEYEEIGGTDTDDTDDNSECDSIAEDLKIIGSHFGETGDCVAMATRSSRASFSAALHRPSARASVIGRQSMISTLASMEEAREASRPTSKAEDTHATHASADIASLMNDDRVRECLVAYWSMTFASTAQGEAFPLFAMARDGGLGIEERAIGIIGAGSGLLFCICQYFIFSSSMKQLGLHQTMVLSGLLAVMPAIFIPLSLLFHTETGVLVYLSILNGIMLIFFSNWNAALTIRQNRTVDSSDRAKLNGLAAVGASVGRGFGPLFAGVLVTLSYTSGIVPTKYGSIVVYIVIAVMGFFAYLQTKKLEDEDKEGEQNDK